MMLQALPWWFKTALLGAGLAFLYALEQQWPTLGAWLFVGLSLTLGMGHGALDTALLLGQFKPHSRAMAYGLLYLALTLLSGWLLSLSFAWALIALLLMSVWHFGELYAQRIWLRLAVGGVSVMAPALLQSTALGQLLQGAAPEYAARLLGLWSGLAWAWAALACLVVFTGLCSQRNRTMFGNNTVHLQTQAVLEISIVLALNWVLSPLFAFALYFGLYHCTAHIARVQRAAVRHQGLSGGQVAWAWCASMLLTAVLMAALWQWLPSAGQWAGRGDAQLLHWLVVALGAVTVPHLLLVGYSGRWLGR
jgi:beta-carotene 15,15'-dioxygenase